jgi:hypothetical protein
MAFQSAAKQSGVMNTPTVTIETPQERESKPSRLDLYTALREIKIDEEFKQLVPAERDILSRSLAREERAQRLANEFVKFIGDTLPLLIRVRQDFLDKEPERDYLRGQDI